MCGNEDGGGDDRIDEFACTACERTFESRRALARHVRDVGLVD